jgi:hypothetical protein
MAFWMAETAAREIVKHLGDRRQDFLENPFASENDLAERTVINIDDYIRQQRQAM